MQVKIKTKNRKELKFEALVDSGCIHTRIDKQLVKNKRIQTWPINFSFGVYNANGTKNRDITRIVYWKLKSTDIKNILKFKELKNKITSQLVFSLPKRENKFRVEMDASEYIIGGVLSQEQERK